MGSNQYGQLGLNAPFSERGRDGSNEVYTKILPCLIESLQGFVISDIASGNDHCLALTEAGDKIFSWGQGKYGALGISKSQNMRMPVEVEKHASVIVDMIAAGARHSAFICRNYERDLYMFGHATSGQLGLGEDCIDRAFKPEKVQFSEKGLLVAKVALGESHSLVLTS
jgi:alpha-tubulin suppressor-like RCC1 family protein